MNPTRNSDEHRLRLRAPAKVNLRLRIVGRRADGYHLLESILAPVGLYDDVHLSRETAGGIRLRVAPADAPVPAGPDNLAWRAAEAFGKAAGVPVHARIRLVKRIPVAAGLGGGSSDAAAVLRGLNALHGRPLSSPALAEIGLRLGADVPFFLHGGCAVARGIGERLAAFDLRVRPWFLLVHPGFPVATAEVYRALNFQLTNQEPESNLACPIGTMGELRALMRNDLETVTCRSFPEVGRVLGFLRDRTPSGVQMSGSGPTVFGVLEHRAQGLGLREEIARARPHWSTFLVRMAPRDDLALGEG